MCGITGIFDLKERRSLSRELLRDMNNTQITRGPDGEGLFLAPGVGLGHRRLAIIDLDAGKQPMSNEDQNIWVTYNGEIYNFKELRHELEALGCHFKTNCDTEVIVYAWQHWGDDCVEHFNGMFAFAIWDGRTEELFLARDRLGIKPLYYSVTKSGYLLFGSELKSIMVHPDFEKELDTEAISDFFHLGYVPDPKSIFKGTLKLAPGHTARVRRGNREVVIRQYWDVQPDSDNAESLEESQQKLLDGLGRAIDFRMIADVPLGAFLSGGVDSSAVVALMASRSPSAVNTCSMRFDNPAFNEDRYAAMVAERYKTNHRVEQVAVDDFGLLDRLVNIYDEPFADSSAIPTYRVCELARKSVTVALSGDGGDETFAGYRRYSWHVREERFRNLLPESVRGVVLGALGRLYPGLAWAPRFLRAKSTLISLSKNSVDGYFDSISIMPPELHNKLFQPSFKSALGDYSVRDRLAQLFDKAPSRDPLTQAQYADLKTYLPGDILTKVDRASMAHSLEVRVPFLDHNMVNFAFGLDPDKRWKNGVGKRVLKKSLEHLLPPDVLYRDKMGFAVPLGAWFKGPLKEKARAVLEGRRIGECGVLDPDEAAKLIDHHCAGIRDYSPIIWSIMMFDGLLARLEEN